MSSDVAKKEELAQARATASQIRQGIHNYLATLALIARANKEQHWRVLGYADWQSYVDGEFGAERLRLPAEHRQKAVAELRLAGLSTRAIGVAVGVDEKTVRNDLRGAEFSAPDSITGTDGKTYAASRPDRPAARGEEADGQPDAPGLPGPGVREARTGSEDRVRAADSSVEGSGDDSTDGAERRNSILEGSDAAGAPADFPDAGAPDPTTAPAPADRPPAGAGVTTDPVALVQAALDKHVPDSNPHREWQRKFMATLVDARKVMRPGVEQAVECLDDELADELLRLAEDMGRYAVEVLKARKERYGNNVIPLRGVS